MLSCKHEAEQEFTVVIFSILDGIRPWRPTGSGSSRLLLAWKDYVLLGPFSSSFILEHLQSDPPYTFLRQHKVQPFSLLFPEVLSFCSGCETDLVFTFLI